MTAVVKEVYDSFEKAGVPEEDAWAPRLRSRLANGTSPR
jgi:hypothetical protein